MLQNSAPISSKGRVIKTWGQQTPEGEVQTSFPLEMTEQDASEWGDTVREKQVS